MSCFISAGNDNSFLWAHGTYGLHVNIVLKAMFLLNLDVYIQSHSKTFFFLKIILIHLK